MLRLILLLFSLTPVLALAVEPTGFGGVALNLMTPVSVISSFINSGCILIGGCFIFASIIKYFEYRRSPMMVTLSTVFFLLIAGIVLMLLPFIYVLYEGGSPFAGFSEFKF